MSLKPQNPRVLGILATFVVLLVFALSFGLLRSTLACAFDVGVPCEEIALDGDGTDDLAFSLLNVDQPDLLDFSPQREVIASGVRVRNLSHPPATPPPISA
jgi:hypothetical protein